MAWRQRAEREAVADGRDVGVIDQPRSGGPCTAWLLYEGEHVGTVYERNRRRR